MRGSSIIHLSSVQVAGEADQLTNECCSRGGADMCCVRGGADDSEVEYGEFNNEYSCGTGAEGENEDV